MIMRGFIGGLATAGVCFAMSASSRPTSRPFRTVSLDPLSSPVSRYPEAPRRRVDLSEIAPGGRTIAVRANGSLQQAIHDARGGDVITLEPGAVYRGPFRLPRKDGDGWIVITSRVPPPRLGEGQHVTPASPARMPKLVAASDSVVIADAAAHHYRLVGLEIAPSDGVFLRDLVQLGSTESSANDLPHDIIIDRCYLHGDRARGTRRGVALNARDAAIVHSYLSDFKEVGADSQAIAGWNGSGPFLIADNYLEGAGENVMFGGADPAIPNLVPADIEVLRNHMAKPLAWRAGDREYGGVAWTVKNLFELKNARRVRVDGNVFEYNWPQAQNGFAILFTVRNQDGASPWSTVEDVLFQNNLVRHVAAGINVLGTDDIHASQPTRRIAIRNNLFVDVGGDWGAGRLFQLLDGTSDVSIDHNTALQTDIAVAGGDRTPHARFVFENNVLPLNRYGVIGSGTGPGYQTLDRYFPNAVVRRNVLIGGSASTYPPDNFFPSSIDRVGFVEQHRGDYRLAASSAYKHRGTDGRDPGAEIDAVAPAILHELGRS
jgi:hypothetical protein